MTRKPRPSGTTAVSAVPSPRDPNSGKSATRSPEAPTDVLDRTTLAKDSAALTELGRRSTEIAQRFGDGSPYERSRLVGETRFYMGQSAEAMLEVGKRLVQLKENEPHGDFTEIVTEQLGLGLRTAQAMMQAAVKFLSPALASKAQSVALLGRSKLFDLMTESDEDIDALASGGTLAGKTLTDMQAMTRKELQAALVEARKNADAKDKVIKAKSAKLDKIEEDAAARRNATMEEAEAYQLGELRTTTLAVENAVVRMLAAIDEVMNRPATDAAAKNARFSLDYTVQRLADGCLARGIAVDLAKKFSPIWADQIERDVAAVHARS